MDCRLPHTEGERMKTSEKFSCVKDERCAVCLCSRHATPSK